MAEVSNQVSKEVSSQVRPLHDWMLSFWSNGSGRPPGFFQMRIKQDDERYARLETETRKQSDVLERLDANLQQITLEREVEKERKQRRQERVKFWLPIAKWVAGGIGTVLLALAIWLYHAAVPVIRVLWEDYLRAHPMVMQKLQNISSWEDDPSYADGGRLPLDAGGPNTY